MLYLAQPYSDPSPDVQAQRALLGLGVAVALQIRGWHVYAPIVHWCEAAYRFDLPKDADFWHRHNRHMIERSDSFGILRIPGWYQSKGVRLEADHARQITALRHSAYYITIASYRYDDTSNEFLTPLITIDPVSWPQVMEDLDGQNLKKRGDG